jgi:uncharacterized phage protein (TIGR02216 family)
MMAVGFGCLRLAPRDFWSLTFPELLAALDGLYGIADTTAPPARADLERLMQRFPDAG